MSDSQRPIDFSTQRFTSTLPKYLVAGAVIVSLTVGWTKVATTDYVNKKAEVADAKFAKMAVAQTETATHVKTLANAQAETDKRMKLVVRLVSAEYIAHVDEAEARPKRRRNRPMSSKAKRVAAALQIDPADPLAGLELLEP